MSGYPWVTSPRFPDRGIPWRLDSFALMPFSGEARNARGLVSSETSSPTVGRCPGLLLHGPGWMYLCGPADLLRLILTETAPPLASTENQAFHEPEVAGSQVRPVGLGRLRIIDRLMEWS
jgi:hypothetical protein